MIQRELQLGNYVLINNSIRKIEQLTKHKVGYHLKENECIMHYARYNEVSPIEINKEILLRNGFIERIYNKLHFNTFDFKIDAENKITINLNGSGSIFVRINDNHYCNKLKYVHELQNILILMKYNKNIIL